MPNSQPSDQFGSVSAPACWGAKAGTVSANQLCRRPGSLLTDGRWIAYISNETGKFEVYVQSFPEKGDKIPISTDGGAQPKWRADGRELYYYTPDRKLMAVEVDGENSVFKVGVARTLFEIRVIGSGMDRGFPGSGYYTPARDGSRFLVVGTPEEPEHQQIVIILNWTADLKK